MNDIESAYAKLSSHQRSALLSSLAAELTVQARRTYAAGSEDNVDDPRRLRLLNEMQHVILSHLRDLRGDHEDRYPDEVFARTLTNWASDMGLVPLVTRQMKIFVDPRPLTSRPKPGRRIA